MKEMMKDKIKVKEEAFKESESEKCELLCREFQEGGDTGDMINLNLLTAASPKVQGNDGALVCPISTAAPATGYWVSMIVDSGAGESVTPPDAFSGISHYGDGCIEGGIGVHCSRWPRDSQSGSDAATIAHGRWR